ncbi:hypothetical protein [Salinimicrobium xinjiangense]|uniref:hypothetical protein n=1 Tax=Salinimicrobium xinjiangense TaxID=438596 RepID=UPI000419D269|nr:hypothetical protein [Salinimicrobium xinjiangense]
MKTGFSFLILLLSLYSCSTLEEHILQEEVYSADYKELLTKEEFNIIDIDSVNNIPELTSQMAALACERKTAGLKFTFDEKAFHLTANARCPNPRETSCHFQQIQITIINDSIVRSPFGIIKEPIENLEDLVTEISNKPYFFRIKKDIMKRGLIHLYFEENEDISTAKKVLAEIAEVFGKMNSGEKTDFFEYDILITEYSPIPPPPPPFEASE